MGGKGALRRAKEEPRTGTNGQLDASYSAPAGRPPVGVRSRGGNVGLREGRAARAAQRFRAAHFPRPRKLDELLLELEKFRRIAPVLENFMIGGEEGGAPTAGGEEQLDE